MGMILQILVYSFVAFCKKTSLSTFDDFPLPGKMYRPIYDPSNTIVDGSLVDDVMEWKIHEIEFMKTRYKGHDLNGLTKIEEPDGTVWMCEVPKHEKVDAEKVQLDKKERSRRFKKWRKALEPLKIRNLIHVSLMVK